MQNQELELDTRLWLVITNDISKQMYFTLIYTIKLLVVQTQKIGLEIIRFIVSEFVQLELLSGFCHVSWLHHTRFTNV